jgi:hypothetical protein
VSRQRTRLSGNGRPKGRVSYIATYANNTTIKISGGAKVLTATSGTKSLLYTVPANKELFLSSWNHPASATTLAAEDPTTAGLTVSLTKGAIINARFGPGTKLYVDIPSLGSIYVYLVCTEYENTP